MTISYTLIRSARKTISIQITPAGEVLVRCPNRMAKRDVQIFVDSKRGWIEKHLSRLDTQPDLPPCTKEELHALAMQAKAFLPERVHYVAAILGVTYGRITIRSQHSRWGSCSSKGNLNFNCLLMLTPPEVRDYVIVHELCHRKEMNHSPKFWAEVESILPDYKAHKEWLKDNGSGLIRRLTPSRNE